MRLSGLAPLSLAFAAATASAEVQIRLAEGRVDLQATAAPLADVLDRLARQTGMKVVYEGPAPRFLVSLSLERRTPVEAVLGTLEGLGLNYALQLDPTGTRVQTLVMAGATSPSASFRSTATPVPTSRVVPPPISSADAIEDTEAFDEPVEEDLEPEPPPQVVPPPGGGIPIPGATPPPVPGLTGPGAPPFNPMPYSPFAGPTPGIPTPGPVLPPGLFPQPSPSPSPQGPSEPR
jgi:hypothetical protein